MGTFFNDLDLIEAFAKYDNDLADFKRLRQKKHSTYSGSFYFGEYISQGALKIAGNCSIVSMQDIVDAGPFLLRPEFGEFAIKKAAWANEVIALRQTFYHCQSTPFADEDEVEAAMHIGDMYEPPWKVPMALAFLALKPRRVPDRCIIKTFRQLDITGQSVLFP